MMEVTYWDELPYVYQK